MRVLFFGTYDPAYSRNRVLLKGFTTKKVDIIQCIDRSRGPLKYAKLFFRGLWLRGQYDVMFVAFPGQEVMLLARMVSSAPIVFDAFTSHHEGYVLDRRTVRPGSLRSWWYRWLDRTACRFADAIITDTQAHIDLFVSESHISPSRFHRIFVGTDPEVMRLAGSEPTGPFSVHFHGTVIPLQGIPTILQAAELLKDEEIVFNLIGVNRHRVPYEQLADEMARAHVCLGIFGDTIKTQRVIPNKVFEALAVGRAVITADTPAIRELLDDRSAILIPTANPRALADAILHLKQNPEIRRRIGTSGHDVFMERATPEILTDQVMEVLASVVAKEPSKS